MAITYRRVKGSALTSDEVDDNFQELSDDVEALQTADAAKLNIDGSLAMTGNLDLGTHNVINAGKVHVEDNGRVGNASETAYIDFGASGIMPLNGTIRLPNLTATTVPYLNASNDLVSSSVTPTELALLSGISTPLATQAYADALVVGLWDDRGNYNASVNTFPASGGSGSAGIVKKGDIWTVSVAGTLGGHSVTAGDTVRALQDTPGQTDSNWAIAENNIGYVAENSANKDTDGTLAANSDTKYASQKAVKTYVDAHGTTYASQAEVNAGTVSNKSIAPDTNKIFVNNTAIAMAIALG